MTAEEPSMVIESTQSKDEEWRKIGIQAQFKKDRAAHVDPRRTVRFNLEDGKMELLTGGKIVGSCE